MYEVFAMEDGRVVKIDEIQENVWINMVRPSEEEIVEVCTKLNVCRECITAALDDEEGSRIEMQDDYSLILIDAPATEIRNQRDEYATFPLSINVTSHAVVTVCLKNIFAINSLLTSKHKQIKKIDVEKRNRFASQILFRVAMQYQNYLKLIEKKRMAIEASIRNRTQRNDLFELHELESNLVYFKTSLSANISVVERLSRQFKFVTEPEDRDLMDDVVIETDQALEMTTTYSEIVKGTRQLVQADINNSLTGVMKFLTSITLVISIPTMISGIYGMNFINIPLGENPWGFYINILFMAVIIVVAIKYLRKRELWR